MLIIINERINLLLKFELIHEVRSEDDLNWTILVIINIESE